MKKIREFFQNLSLNAAFALTCCGTGLLFVGIGSLYWAWGYQQVKEFFYFAVLFFILMVIFLLGSYVKKFLTILTWCATLLGRLAKWIGKGCWSVLSVGGEVVMEIWGWIVPFLLVGVWYWFALQTKQEPQIMIAVSVALWVGLFIELYLRSYFGRGSENALSISVSEGKWYPILRLYAGGSLVGLLIIALVYPTIINKNAVYSIVFFGIFALIMLVLIFWTPKALRVENQPKKKSGGDMDESQNEQSHHFFVTTLLTFGLIAALFILVLMFSYIKSPIQPFAVKAWAYFQPRSLVSLAVVACSVLLLLVIRYFRIVRIYLVIHCISMPEKQLLESMKNGLNCEELQVLGQDSSSHSEVRLDFGAEEMLPQWHKKLAVQRFRQTIPEDKYSSIKHALDALGWMLIDHRKHRSLIAAMVSFACVLILGYMWNMIGNGYDVWFVCMALFGGTGLLYLFDAALFVPKKKMNIMTPNALTGGESPTEPGPKPRSTSSQPEKTPWVKKLWDVGVFIVEYLWVLSAALVVVYTGTAVFTHGPEWYIWARLHLVGNVGWVIFVGFVLGVLSAFIKYRRYLSVNMKGGSASQAKKSYTTGNPNRFHSLEQWTLMYETHDAEYCNTKLNEYGCDKSYLTKEEWIAIYGECFGRYSLEMIHELQNPTKEGWNSIALIVDERALIEELHLVGVYPAEVVTKENWGEFFQLYLREIDTKDGDHPEIQKASPQIVKAAQSSFWWSLSIPIGFAVVGLTFLFSQPRSRLAISRLWSNIVSIPRDFLDQRTVVKQLKKDLAQARTDREDLRAANTTLQRANETLVREKEVLKKNVMKLQRLKANLEKQIAQTKSSSALDHRRNIRNKTTTPRAQRRRRIRLIRAKRKRPKKRAWSLLDAFD